MSSSDPGDDPAGGFGIGTLSARTGVPQATLRAWEGRYGFPRPERLPSGHRRYRDADVDAVDAVLAERAGGRTIPAAIEHVLRSSPPVLVADTLFAGWRHACPDLPVAVLSRRAMLALSRAIEDECAAQAARPLLVAAFQDDLRWRKAWGRWERLVAVAEEVVILSDGPPGADEVEGLRRLDVGQHSPLLREWSLLCHAPGFGAVLAGWERADGRFEAVWSAEPARVELARTVARGIVERLAPGTTGSSAWTRAGYGSSVAAGRSAESIANRAFALLDP